MSNVYYPTDSLNAMNVGVTVTDTVSGEEKNVKLADMLHGYVVADENNQFRGMMDDSQNLSILTGESLPDYSDANEGDVLQIDDGEPVWGAVDALPEIEESDEGKVLAVSSGEASWEDAPSGLPSIAVADAGKVLTVNDGGTAAEWADAPSGLPEITNSDEGKVLTVVGETEHTVIIPEQSLTTAGTLTATATITEHAENPPESMTVEIDGVAYSNVQFDSTNGYYDISDGTATVGQITIYGDVWEFVKTPAGTYALSAYIESPREYSAQWAEPSGGIIIATEENSVLSLTYEQVVAAVENGTYIVLKKTLEGMGLTFGGMVTYGVRQATYAVVFMLLDDQIVYTGSSESGPLTLST